MYGILRHNVQNATVFVRRGPERALAQRHIVEEIGSLPSEPPLVTRTVITVPSFAPVGRGSPAMAPFSNIALSSDASAAKDTLPPA